MDNRNKNTAKLEITAGHTQIEGSVEDILSLLTVLTGQVANAVEKNVTLTKDEIIDKVAEQAKRYDPDQPCNDCKEQSEVNEKLDKLKTKMENADGLDEMLDVLREVIIVAKESDKGKNDGK